MGKYDDCVIFSENMEFPTYRPIPWLAKLASIPEQQMKNLWLDVGFD